MRRAGADELTAPVLRPAARVLVLAASGRTLLMRFRAEDGGPGFWVPPGGGLEDGEDARLAALRELREETGRDDLVLEGPVGTRAHVFAWRGRTWDQRETWFLARCAEEFEPVPLGWSAEEHEDVDAVRWWSPAEVRAGADRFVPADLADLLEQLAARGTPTGPRVLGR